MKPGNRTHKVKIIYDEVIPFDPEGLAGDEPIDFNKELRLPIVSRAIEGDDPIDLEEEHLGYPEHRLSFRKPKK